MTPRREETIALFLFLLACLAAGAIGSLVTTPAVEGWYQGIQKPTWTPPNQVFGPVWGTLYIMMAFAGWLAWRQSRRTGARLPVVAFCVQLVLNTAWSFCFFGLRNPAAGFIEIVILWCAVVATTVIFFRVSRAAGLLFVPYLAWVTFAAALNFAVWRLNA